MRAYDLETVSDETAQNNIRAKFKKNLSFCFVLFSRSE